MSVPTIAMVGAGAMGSAVARRLTGKGSTVLTAMTGRSPASLERARQAGMSVVPTEALGDARLVLSIVPPDAALPAAERLAQVIAQAPTPPIYVDCNAIRPALAREIGDMLAARGVDFVDGGIIGGVPTETYAGPIFYISGPRADEVMVLNEGGIITKSLGPSIGAASAIKMSYGGITKGHIALGAAMLLAAQRAGVGDALLSELAASQRGFLTGYTRSIPDMFGKSRRWVPEMQEIAGFLGDSRAEQDIWRALALFYTQMADDFDGARADIDALAAMIDRAKEKAGN